MTEINTHHLIVDFGKHKGTPWTHVPVSYLNWLVNSAPIADTSNRSIAAAELKRRGTVTPKIEVSGHAIDRASLSCRKVWHQTARDENEGIHAWLCRMSAEAIERGEKLNHGKIRYSGLDFVFEFGECYPTLVTVMPA